MQQKRKRGVTDARAVRLGTYLGTVRYYGIIIIRTLGTYRKPVIPSTYLFFRIMRTLKLQSNTYKRPPNSLPYLILQYSHIAVNQCKGSGSFPVHRMLCELSLNA